MKPIAVAVIGPSGRVIHCRCFARMLIVITVLPIITIYPFMQRYFLHGVMIGSLKE